MKNIVIITGSSGLLGRAFVRACTAAGMNVVAVDVQKPASLPTRAIFYRCDITKPNDVKKLVTTVRKTYGRIDGLVNCAYPRTKNFGKKFEDVSYEDFCKNLSIHLGGYFFMTKLVALVMKEQRSGSIVFLGSIYGSRAPKFELYEGTTMTMPVAYAAIKGGILSLTRYLASYFGPHNIRVNAISPGGIENSQPSQFVRRYVSQTRLGRMATPQDIAGMLVFLLSDASSYITGQNIVIDGGFGL